MSLQDRTLVVKNFDRQRTTKQILTELFTQTGPVKNVVLKPDYAFVEFDDKDSVGYSKALLEGVYLHGRKLKLDPKNRDGDHYKYRKMLLDVTKYWEIQAGLRPVQQQEDEQWIPPSHRCAQSRSLAAQQNPGSIGPMRFGRKAQHHNNREHPYERNNDNNSTNYECTNPKRSYRNR